MKTHPVTGDLDPNNVDLFEAIKTITVAKSSHINSDHDKIIVGLVERK